VREGAEESEDVEEPEDHGNHDDAIENGLDGALHRDEAVHQPEQNSDDNQNYDDVNQGHKTSS